MLLAATKISGVSKAVTKEENAIEMRRNKKLTNIAYKSTINLMDRDVFVLEKSEKKKRIQQTDQ